MAAAITDVEKTAADVGIDTVTINDDASTTGSELDRGADTDVMPVTVLLTITGFAAAPDAGGYMKVALAPLDGTGGILFDDTLGDAIVPVTADALYKVPVSLTWYAGCRYAKVIVTNKSGQNTDASAVSAEMRWQAGTL